MGLERDIIYFCGHCQTGLILKDNRIQHLDVRYVAPAIPNDDLLIYLPFWRFFSNGKLFDRQTHQSFARQTFRKKPPGNIKPDGQPVPGPHKVVQSCINRHFYVPAFETPEIIRLGANYTRHQPPALAPESPAATNIRRLIAGVISESEAREVADLIYIQLEAAQPDFLKSIDFALDLSQPEIIAFPFAWRAPNFHDLTFDVRLFKDWVEDWEAILRLHLA